MKYKKLASIRYDRDLKYPFRNSQVTYQKRTGHIIKLYIDDFCGCGEASPLPIFSKENVKQVEWAIEEVKAALSPHIDYSKEELVNIFKLITEQIPSLNFALDIALYDILGQKEKISIAKYLNKNAFDEVTFSSMYTKDISSKNNVFKIKFSCKDYNTDIKNLEKIARKNILFRVDANRNYSLQDAISLCYKLKRYNIEYIEEPVRNIDTKKIKELKKHTNIPIAIDESIMEDNYKELIASKLINYAILKAPLFGSIEKIFLFKNYLEENNVKLILSSALQTKIGNMSSINIAAALNNNTHGLNNYNFFDYMHNEMPYNEKDTKVSIKNIIGLGVCQDD